MPQPPKKDEGDSGFDLEGLAREDPPDPFEREEEEEGGAVEPEIRSIDEDNPEYEPLEDTPSGENDPLAVTPPPSGDDGSDFDLAEDQRKAGGPSADLSNDQFTAGSGEISIPVTPLPRQEKGEPPAPKPPAPRTLSPVRKTDDKTEPPPRPKSRFTQAVEDDGPEEDDDENEEPYVRLSQQPKTQTRRRKPMKNEDDCDEKDDAAKKDAKKPAQESNTPFWVRQIMALPFLVAALYCWFMIGPISGFACLLGFVGISINIWFDAHWIEHSADFLRYAGAALFVSIFLVYEHTLPQPSGVEYKFTEREKLLKHADAITGFFHKPVNKSEIMPFSDELYGKIVRRDANTVELPMVNDARWALFPKGGQPYTVEATTLGVIVEGNKLVFTSAMPLDDTDAYLIPYNGRQTSGTKPLPPVK